MTNNDILRRIRYVFDLNDSDMMSIFSLGGIEVSRAQVSSWLKKDDDPDYRSCSDPEMAMFLNGFITRKRGQKEGGHPEPEKTLTNNIILRKIKIALNMQNEDVLEIMKLSGFRLSKHELSAFFRRTDHKHYRLCKDQVLRNFLQGLQMKHRPKAPDTTEKKPAEHSFSGKTVAQSSRSSSTSNQTSTPSAKKVQRKPSRRPEPSGSGFDWNNLKK